MQQAPTDSSLPPKAFPMMRVILAFVCALFFPASLLAKESQPAAAPKQAVERATPALWQVEAPGKPGRLYLFGTAHLLPAGLEWRSKPLVKALDASKLMVQELSPAETKNPALFGELVKAGLLLDGTTLDQLVGPELYARLAERLKNKVPEASLKRMRPWLAAILLSQQMMQQSGLDPANGAERTLTAEAEKRGMAIEGLETIAVQVKALSVIEADGAKEMLAQSLDEMADAPQYIAALVDAWKSGQVDRLEAGFLKDVDKFPKAYDALLVQRNRSWMEPLDAYLERKTPVFVAVGAGHMVGKDGLVALLTAKGYRVKLLQPSGANLTFATAVCAKALSECQIHKLH